jgi:alanine racemase
MSPTGIVEVDLAALERNYAYLASACAPGACGAVVKAGAYGLGIGPVARRLWAAGCRHYFVATVAEGIELRGLLPSAQILVFEGLAGNEAEAFSAAGLIPILNTRAELRVWGGAGPAAVHVDTGMSRLGLSQDDVAALALEADRMPAVDVRFVLTHLACADEVEHGLNREQVEVFAKLRALWPEAKTSIANSAGILLGEGYRCDLSRPGIALYGGNPMRRGESPVEPVVRVKARVLQLRDVAAGRSIGYGASFTAEAPMRVAVVGIGYADGYLRSLSNCGIAEIAGRRVPVVGRVSMDLVCLDVTAVPRGAVAEGDWATMIGGAVALEEVAALAGTINYELLTALGPRLGRVYLEEPA